MKKYRIDVFPKHKKYYFDTETEAINYGLKQVLKGNIVFLLKHTIDNKYAVVSEIK